MQNAIDACRELEDYLYQYPALTKLELTTQGAEVVISLEDKGAEGRWLEVSDRGLGMTQEVLRQYFLKAGVTFRRSDVWRKVHESSDGKSRVLRSGRFGVGVLAAFLIGDELEVSTRHLNSAADGGLTFKATIDTEAIELIRSSRPVGTTIRIRVGNEAIWRDLATMMSGWSIDPNTGRYSRRSGQESWDWYCLSEPKVQRIIMGKTLEQRFSLQGSNADLGLGTHRISLADYEDIQWCYGAGPYLAVNGIIVSESRNFASIRDLEVSGGFPMICPNVSVFDPDGNLPLVLQRTGLTTAKYPFHQELFADVIRDWLAFFLVYAPGAQISSEQVPKYGRLYPGLSQDYGDNWQETSSGQFCSAEEGVYPSDSWNIRQGNFHKFLIASEQITGVLTTPFSSEAKGSLVVPVFGFTGAQMHRRWTRFALCGDEFEQGFGWLKDFRTNCRRMLLSKTEFQAIKKGRIIASYLWNRVTEESSNQDWVVVRSGNCNCEEHFDLLALSDKLPKNAYYPVFIEWHLADSQSSLKELSPLAKLWSEKLPSPLIPYDFNERRSIFAAAYTDLKDSISGHEVRLGEEKNKEQAKASKDA
jgi:molecular chaperone HtpG